MSEKCPRLSKPLFINQNDMPITHGKYTRKACVVSNGVTLPNTLAGVRVLANVVSLSSDQRWLYHRTTEQVFFKKCMIELLMSLS
jgi:hypothetical protein